MAGGNPKIGGEGKIPVKIKNESLLERIRNSDVKGPFEVKVRDSAFLQYTFDTDIFTPLLKRFNKEKEVSSASELAQYFENCYLGASDDFIQRYNWEYVGERNDFFSNGKILKLRSIPHPDSVAARKGFPDYHIWLKINPSPFK